MRPLSKKFYVGSVLGSYMLGDVLILILVMFGSDPIELLEQGEIWPATTIAGIMVPIVLVIYMSAVLLILWYKAWEAIQDGTASITPGKAIGLMFVPLFNFYWVYRVCYGYAKNCNEYLVRHNLDLPRLSEDRFLGFSLLVTFAPVIRMLAPDPFSHLLPFGIIRITMPIAIIINFYAVISDLCNTVNSLRVTTEKTSGRPEIQ